MDLESLPVELLNADPLPLVATMRRLAEQAPGRPALTCAGRTVNRAELEDRSDRLARAYRDRGVSEDDVVTIALDNGIEHFAATLATWKLGAIPNPVSPRLPLVERKAIVELADPKLVIGVADADHPARQCLRAGYTPGETDSSALLAEPLSKSMAMMTSGGSTGRPKIIVNAQPAAVHPLLPRTMGMREAGVVLAPSPQYHTAGFQFPWWALLLGSHVITLPAFDAVEALESIQKYRVDWINLVPTMMARMLRVIEASPDRFDLSSLSTVIHGAAPCPPRLKEAWIELVGPDRLTEVYAATEGWFGAMITGREWLEHRGSVGRPMSDIKILGPNGRELATGEVGEICAALPPGTAASRYIGAEARRFGDLLSVGDLGRLDEDNYLYISDRRVDMIITGGANVFPAEVEAAILEHPRALSAIVVGLPHEDLGQQVHAVVEADGDLHSDELLDFLSNRLVRYKIPRSIRFVTEPLRDDAGKARRSAIRDREIELLLPGSRADG